MPPRGNHLRDYQQKIVTRVHREWNRHRSVMVQMPTGTGKTHVLASIVSAFSGRMLIVAHRVELVEQIKETVRKLRIKNEELRIVSIQAVTRRIDTLDFEPMLVVIDEAHHALAKTYRILWEKWPKARFLGLTATPCRMNHAGFKDLFDTLVTSMNMADFIRKGMLSAFDYVSIHSGSMEQRLIDSLQKRGADGDFQVKEMDEVLNKRPSIERLYLSMERFAAGKKGIVYAISINHAHSIAEFYNQKGIRTVAIDSKTPREERKRMVEAFKHGEIQVIVNVDVFSEGFDCPDVEFVQMTRPTLSLAKYLQQVGRGLRMSEGKETCMLIDNVGLYQVFGLPVQAWDWERMFRGEWTGKGIRATGETRHARYCASLQEKEKPEEDMGLSLVISHETLLDKLNELDKCPETEEKATKLRRWQEAETGLWGLKRGREKRTKATYITIFDIRDDVAAVRFPNNDCGLVNDSGEVIWRRKSCVSLKITRDKLVEIELEGNEKNYLDLYNLKLYSHQPEIIRYGTFELLKVRQICHSRTQRCYTSKAHYDSLIIIDKGFMLKITEKVGEAYCILKNDPETYYRIYHWLPDKGAVVYDTQNDFFRITKDGKKIHLGNGSADKWEKCKATLTRMEEEIIKEMEAEEKKKRQKIFDSHQHAIPYQSGIKWGLKVGNRITVPPIYRQVATPIGKYCAVEKNYSQWGIITIDGTVLIEPKYPNVSIKENGTALLTLVTGKTISVRLNP